MSVNNSSETKTVAKCGTGLEEIIPFLSEVDTTCSVPYPFKVPKHALACAFFVYCDSERESIAHRVYNGLVRFVVRRGAWVSRGCVTAGESVDDMEPNGHSLLAMIVHVTFVCVCDLCLSKCRSLVYL